MTLYSTLCSLVLYCVHTVSELQQNNNIVSNDATKVIKRERHQIPTMAGVQAQLVGKAVFTVVDMKNAFCHVKLSNESARMCAFSTPWGRKCFTRMPFELASASEVLQEGDDRTFGTSQTFT